MGAIEHVYDVQRHCIAQVRGAHFVHLPKAVMCIIHTIGTFLLISMRCSGDTRTLRLNNSPAAFCATPTCTRVCVPHAVVHVCGLHHDCPACTGFWNSWASARDKVLDLVRDRLKTVDGEDRFLIAMTGMLLFAALCVDACHTEIHTQGTAWEVPLPHWQHGTCTR